jgi:hypothetical protein
MEICKIWTTEISKTMNHLPNWNQTARRIFAQHSGRLRIQKILRWIEKLETNFDIWALSLSNGSEY